MKEYIEALCVNGHLSWFERPAKAKPQSVNGIVTDDSVELEIFVDRMNCQTCSRRFVSWRERNFDITVHSGVKKGDSNVVITDIDPGFIRVATGKSSIMTDF